MSVLEQPSSLLAQVADRHVVLARKLRNNITVGGVWPHLIRTTFSLGHAEALDQFVPVLQQCFTHFTIDFQCWEETADETKQVVAPRSFL